MSERTIGKLKLWFIAQTEDFVRRNKEVQQAVGKTEQDFKQFFRTQRTGDRIQREGAQSLVMLASAASMLGGGGGKLTQLNSSVMAAVSGMQAMEFTTFALARSSGVLGASIAALAGPIGIAVAVGAGLLVWLQSSKVAAEELDNQLRDLEIQMGRNLEARRAELVQQRDEAAAQLATMKPSKAMMAWSHVAWLPESWANWIWARVSGGATESDVKEQQVAVLKLEQKIEDIDSRLKRKADEAEREREKLERDEKTRAQQLERENEEVRRQNEQAERGHDRWMQEMVAEAEKSMKRETDRQNQVLQLRVDSIEDVEERERASVEEKYRLERERLMELYAEDARLAEALSLLEKLKARDLQAVTQAANKRVVDGMRSTLGDVRSVTSDLRAILGDAGGQFVQDMMRALEVIESIVSLMQTIGIVEKVITAGAGGVPLPTSGIAPPIVDTRPFVVQIVPDGSEFGKAVRAALRNEAVRRLA